jgi:Clr5 domain
MDSTKAFSTPSNIDPAQPQPDGIFPLDGKQNEARWYKEEDWDAQRPEITRLYENNTLENVMKFMREQHGLKAALEKLLLFSNISATDLMSAKSSTRIDLKIGALIRTSSQTRCRL